MMRIQKPREIFNSICLFTLVILSLSIISAGNLSIFPNPGLSEAGNSILYSFNFSNSTNCLAPNIILNHTEIVEINSRGFGYVSINISNLSQVPTSLCEYKDGTLRKNHSFSDIVFNTIFARNLNLSENLIVLGNSSFNGSLMPRTSLTFDIGSGALRWGNLYVTNISTDNVDILNDLTVAGVNLSGNLSLGSEIFMSADGFIVRTAPGGSVRLNITIGGDMYTAGTFDNDGNTITSKTFTVRKSRTLPYLITTTNDLGFTVYDNSVSDNVMINLTVAGNYIGVGNVTASWFKGKFNWTEISKYLSFDGSTLDFNETELNSSIDSRTISITHNATSIATISGTLDAGNLASIQTPEDDDTYNVSEDVGADPLTIAINFSNVSSLDSIIGRIYYDGGLGHEVQLEIQRSDTGAWENYLDLTDTTDFVNIYAPVFDPEQHVFASGDVAIRFKHVQSGIPTHNFYIDYLAIVDGWTTLTVADHDALGGRDDISNHPWALPTNGSLRSPTGNFNWADYNITNISLLQATTLNITGNLYYGTLDGEGDLNVNSSDFWDNYNVPEDIVYSDLYTNFWDANVDLGNNNFTVNGTTLFVGTNGNVGINTSSPDTAFHIKAGKPGVIGSDHAGQIIIQNPKNDVDAVAAITGYESDGSGDPDQQLWYLGSSASSDENIIFLNRRDAKLALGTNGTARMTILGGGNVGIGTSSPDDELTVVGTANATDFVCSAADGCISDADVSDTLTCSILVAGSSVVADEEVDDDLTIDGGSINLETTTYSGTFGMTNITACLVAGQFFKIVGGAWVCSTDDTNTTEEMQDACGAMASTGLTYSDAGNTLVADLGTTIEDTEMFAEDFGDFTCDGNEDGCTIDTGALTIGDEVSSTAGDNINMDNQNVTAVECILFQSGGRICTS